MTVLMSVQMANSRMVMNALHVQKLAELARMQTLVKIVRLLILCLTLNVSQYVHQAPLLIMESARIAQITATLAMMLTHAQFVLLLLFFSIMNVSNYAQMVLLRPQTIPANHAQRIVKPAIQQNLVKYVWMDPFSVMENVSINVPMQLI